MKVLYVQEFLSKFQSILPIYTNGLDFLDTQYLL